MMNNYHIKRFHRPGGSGQTIIETVFMLIILLVIFFLIAEFARAWYLKNSLNNAVRVAVRAAVVDPVLASRLTGGTTCPSTNPIVRLVCTAPGISNDGNTTVIVSRVDEDSNGVINAGDTVTVGSQATFVPLVPLVSSMMPEFARSAATMRYE